MIRLNLGAGEWRPAGYMSVDITGAVDVSHDLTVRPWPFVDESVSEILASHVLEHMDLDQAELFIGECRRVLAWGGLLHLAVPDLDKFIDCRLAGDWQPLAGYYWTDLNYLMGGDERETVAAQRHRYMWCWASLAWTLEQAGFLPKRRRLPTEWDNPRYAAISLYVDAIK